MLGAHSPDHGIVRTNDSLQSTVIVTLNHIGLIPPDKYSRSDGPRAMKCVVLSLLLSPDVLNYKSERTFEEYLSWDSIV